MALAWNKLAELSTHQSVVIAEIDATPFQFRERFEILGFPTIRLYTKTNKSGIDYRGNRDAPSMISFLTANL